MYVVQQCGKYISIKIEGELDLPEIHVPGVLSTGFAKGNHSFVCSSLPYPDSYQPPRLKPQLIVYYIFSEGVGNIGIQSSPDREGVTM